MTDIEQKALALLNEVQKKMGLYKSKRLDPDIAGDNALCRAIEQHEAFRQEVSDAIVEAFGDGVHPSIEEPLRRFIIPAPKPDPLLAAMNEVIKTADVVQENADQLRAALDARGLTITTVEKD